ncbi:MAG: alpha/beta hydrolase [Fervidobacterium sp.]
MKKVGGWLIFALVLIFVGSFLAQMFNTSFYTVKVKRIKFDTNNGILSGLLYLPKGADSSDPRPTIITTHGYLNSAEMQDAAAIEMSRRGYVVLALDMYDHGHSVNKTQYDSAKAFFSFWPSSQYDAVQYMYNQDYVMKDENGNGIIAVAGHSMGGFSSTMAMVMDEQDYAKTGIRKIHAGLPMGADYSWTSYLGVTPDVAYAAYGPRTVGIVAAHYDEFFFDSAAEKTGKTVVFKDFIGTPEGKAFLGNPSDPNEGVMYTLDNGGRRVIYEPWQTHPWNHFSFITTGHQISFYTKAFEGYTSPNQVNAGLGSENQIWILKEYSEFLALIGFFLLFIPLVMLLMKVPFFAKAKTERAPYVPEPATKNNKIVFWIFYAFSAAFPALFFPSLMNKDGAGITIIQVLSLVILGLGLLFGALLLSRARKEKGRSVKNVRNGMIFISLSSLLLFLTTTFRKNLFVQNKYFNQPTTNQIAFWALIVSEMILILMFVSYYLNKKQSNLTPKQYGFVTNWSSVLSSLLIAIVVVAIGYAILYFVDAIFVTDFRIWTWAVKTFESQNLLAAIKYAPFFFIFYYITGISINANTGSMKKGEGYYLSCISMVGGLVVFLALQYGLLFFTQRALVPNQALNPILLFALIPSLIVATFYTKKLYEETGNVYTGAFLNTILMTLILAANTTTYSGII